MIEKNAPNELASSSVWALQQQLELNRMRPQQRGLFWKEAKKERRRREERYWRIHVWVW